MRLVLIAGVVVGGGLLVASLELFARSARRLMVEPHLGPFRRRPDARGPARPVALVQLEQLVGEALAGPGPSRAKLLEHLAALGCPLPPSATAEQLIGAVAELAAQARDGRDPSPGPAEVRPAEDRR